MSILYLHKLIRQEGTSHWCPAIADIDSVKANRFSSAPGMEPLATPPHMLPLRALIRSRTNNSSRATHFSLNATLHGVKTLDSISSLPSQEGGDPRERNLRPASVVASYCISINGSLISLTECWSGLA